MTANQVPQNPQTNNVTGPKKNSSLKKGLIIAGIVTAVLLVLLIIIGATTSTVRKYSVSDLVPVTNNNIQFTRPSQWQDASYAENIKKDFGLSSVSNASIFGDKVTKDKDGNYAIGNAFVAFGQASSETTDVAVLKTPEFKTKFEEVMNKQLTQDSFKSSTCQTVSNFGITYNYDYNNFPVAVAVKLNCGLSDTEKKKYKADAFEMRIAILMANDGKTYTYALVASDKSWAKNEPVYFQMMRDLKALK